MLGCDFHTAFFKLECQPSTCASAVNIKIVSLLELELPTQELTDTCAVKVLKAVDLWDLVEPLPVLLAKLGEQMIGDKRLFCHFLHKVGSLDLSKGLDLVAILRPL